MTRTFFRAIAWTLGQKSGRLIWALAAAALAAAGIGVTK